jgi:transcriptional regulator of heat shock response
MQGTLNEKLARALEAVVASHILSGRPVSSRHVAAHFRLGLGPASVRNLLARLEGLGYLSKPHTSAGRIPTEKGYRFYVNRANRSSILPSGEARAIRVAIQGAIQGAQDQALSAETVFERVSRSLEEISHQLSVAIAPRSRGSRGYSVHVFGRGNVVAELGNLDEARSLLRILENQQEIAKILIPDRHHPGITVSIGSENHCLPMRRCSVVRSSYGVGNTQGAIGVIGPLRMEYPRLMALVDYTCKELTRFLTTAGGRSEGAKERQGHDPG